MKKHYILNKKLFLVITGFLLLNNNFIKAQCASAIAYQNTQSLPSLSTGYYITAGNNVMVLNGQNVGFQAGSYIGLNPGFSATTGAIFSGDIVPPSPSTLSASINQVLSTSGNFCPGGLYYNLTANPTGQGSYTYLWSTGETTQSIVATPSTSTTYSVSVYDACLNQTVAPSVTLAGIDSHYRGDPTFVFYNAISPNGDGISDHFVLSDNGKTEYAFNACYYDFWVRPYGSDYVVHHSEGLAGPTGFKEGDIYWDAQVKNYTYTTFLRLSTCQGHHDYTNFIVVSGSPYTHFRSAASDSTNNTLFSSFDDHNISLYPNPSSGTVYFNYGGEEKDITISVFSSIGDKIYESSYGKQIKLFASLDLELIPKGLYLFKIEIDDKTVLKKITIE